MKRILIALAMLAAVQVADAQVKSPAVAAKAVAKAEAATADAKKAAKVGTWINLAKSYMDAYAAPAGNAWLGASKQELMLLMGGEQPSAVEQVELGGTPFIKEVYETKDFYFNTSGQLQMIVVTKTAVENPLENALEAYKKAHEVDTKGSKTKDIVEALTQIKAKAMNDAFNQYNLGNFAEASKLFAFTAEVSAAAPLSTVDCEPYYNAGFTAVLVEDYEAAKNYFEKCLANGYYYDNGEVFARLATVYEKLGDAEKGVATLEEGFTKFPQSQNILIGLINYYLANNQEPERLFELIDLAKKNEPTNASLYYVEGNIYKQLGRLEEAEKAYNQCADINPEYEFGYIGAGVMFYDEAIRIQDEASNEMDDAKYCVLVEQFESTLHKAIAPFEKAFELTKDNTLKVNIAEYLKNINYRFSTKGAEYEAAYNKYNEITKNGIN